MDSTLLRAFTTRRIPGPKQVPAPSVTHDAFQRRQAALRQMGLLPALTLSQQEAQLDSFIPPSSPLGDPLSYSEADRIKNEWKNSNENERFQSFKFAGTPLPSPPLTPLTTDFAPHEHLDPDIPPELTTPTAKDSDSDSSAPLTPHSDAPVPDPPINLVINPPPSTLDIILEHDSLPFLPPCQPHSPISADFLPPDSPHSPVHLHPPLTDDSTPLPLRSRSPSLAASTKSRSKSRSRARSPLRFFTTAKDPLPPLPDSPTKSDAPHSDDLPAPIPQPQPPQRKRTVFSRFKRANTVDPSSVSSPSSHSRQKDPQTPSRSKSLFTSVRKTVFGLSAAPIPDPNPTSDALPSSVSTPSTAPPESLPKVDIVLEEPEADSLPQPPPKEDQPAKVDFPTSSDDGQESDSNHDHPRERTPSLCTTNLSINPRKGKKISIILNRERTKSSPPASPLSSTFLSPPASPTSLTTNGGGRLRGRLGRKGTIGSGTDGLLSVWGGVASLLAPSIVTNASGSEEGTDGEVRQALAPTIHNEASISLHMSNIEDEETRRVTEVAFM